MAEMNQIYMCRINCMRCFLAGRESGMRPDADQDQLSQQKTLTVILTSSCFSLSVFVVLSLSLCFPGKFYESRLGPE